MFEKYSNSFLKDFDFDTLLQKFEQKEFLTFEEGSFIYNENDIICYVYFILTGEIVIGRFKNNNETEIIRKAITGDIIGLNDLLTGDYYTNSSRVSKESNVFAVSKKDFIEVTKKNDEFNLWILKYLSNRISDLS